MFNYSTNTFLILKFDIPRQNWALISLCWLQHRVIFEYILTRTECMIHCERFSKNSEELSEFTEKVYVEFNSSAAWDAFGRRFGILYP